VRCGKAVQPERRRRGSSPRAGAVGVHVVVCLRIAKESAEVRGGRESPSVCLSGAREARQGPSPAPASPCSRGQPRLLPADKLRYRLRVKLWRGSSWLWAACGRGVRADPGSCGQAKAASVAAQLPGSAVRCPGASLSCFSLAGCEKIGFILIESLFSEILQISKRRGIVSAAVLQ